MDTRHIASDTAGHKRSQTLAIELSRYGFAVFPCRDDNKRPSCPNGFYDAVADETSVRELWRRFPGGLVGVPTGAVNGFDALDIDPRHGGDRWLETAHIPPTRVHRTRSGGWHFLFRHAEGVRNTASKIAPGVDTRGDGGYIIWWPPTYAPGAPADWPPYLLAAMNPPQEPVGTPVYTAPPERRAQRLIEEAIARVRTAPPGQRHYRLRAAALTLGGLPGFPPQTAAQLLLAAVIDAGGPAVDRKNAADTIQWGLKTGAARPLSFT